MDSAKACLHELHWLPIEARIEFKVQTLVYKGLHSLAPVYIQNCFKFQNKRQIDLRSNSDNLLCVPTIRRQTFASRSLSYAGPRGWNDLPKRVRYAIDLEDFKKELKTFLFRKYFNC